MAKQTNSLAHTKWMCKYYIIFTPKYRQKIVYNQYIKPNRTITPQMMIETMLESYMASMAFCRAVDSM